MDNEIAQLKAQIRQLEQLNESLVAEIHEKTELLNLADDIISRIGKVQHKRTAHNSALIVETAPLITKFIEGHDNSKTAQRYKNLK